MHGQCQGLPIGCLPLAESFSRHFREASPLQIARDALRFSTNRRGVSKAEVVATICPLSELLFGKSLRI
jgi:hypothetical protein